MTDPTHQVTHMKKMSHRNWRVQKLLLHQQAASTGGDR